VIKLGEETTVWDQYLDLGDRKGLRIGAGRTSQAGWTNLDIQPLEVVDVVHDILHIPWPLDDGGFDTILCRDVLEHIPPRTSYSSAEPAPFPDWFQVEELGNGRYLNIYTIDCLIPVMEEIYRIASNRARILIQSPLPGGEYDMGDPTHCRQLHPAMFSHWDARHHRYGKSFHTEAKFEMEWFDTINDNFRLILQKRV
jgi:hypothetical protein